MSDGGEAVQELGRLANRGLSRWPKADPGMSPSYGNPLIKRS